MTAVEEIKYLVEKLMIKNINKVISGESVKEKLLYVRPEYVLAYLESIGAKENDEISTNGWEWDYWLTVTLNGDVYILGGDGWSRDNATFKKK